MNTIQDIRNKFLRLKSSNKIAENGTYEIVNARFVCDENVIFGYETYEERYPKFGVPVK